MTRLKYDVVIAVDHTQKVISSVESLLKLPSSERPAGIYISTGRNPSLQRNIGLGLCKSPLVYFLDEDSWVIPGTAPRLIGHFQGQRTAVAGGPNLPFPDASDFEMTASAVLASWMGSFKVRNRYAPIGSVKEATEKDLILCNMMIRRDVFKKEGGFRTDLYPNEENEFLNRLLHLQYQLIYDPSAAVYRPRRKTFWAFCWQAFRYGRGRARQMKVYPCLSDAVHLIPFFFVLYVLSLLLPFLPVPDFPFKSWLVSPYWRAPFLLFLALSFGTAVSVVSWFRHFLDLAEVPLLIFMRQFFYGIGLFVGLVTPIPKPAPDLRIQTYRVKISANRYKIIPVPLGKRR
jgi:hypothetical protein